MFLQNKFQNNWPRLHPFGFSYFLFVCYRYLLTAAYLIAIQYYTRIGGKVAVSLIKCENNQGEDSSAASLVYKVSIHVFVTNILSSLHICPQNVRASYFYVEEKKTYIAWFIYPLYPAKYKVF